MEAWLGIPVREPLILRRCLRDADCRTTKRRPERGRLFVIASQQVGAKRRPMISSAKQSRAGGTDWIASSQGLLAMTGRSGTENLVHRQPHGHRAGILRLRACL